jgi:hypothetical protein
MSHCRFPSRMPGLFGSVRRRRRRKRCRPKRHTRWHVQPHCYRDPIRIIQPRSAVDFDGELNSLFLVNTEKTDEVKKLSVPLGKVET